MPHCGSLFLIMNLGHGHGHGQYNSGSADQKPAQIIWRQQQQENDDDRVKEKSYTCAFCKRGFSNAQALGGHMNIHRKDRAKLKEAADHHYHFQTLLSLDISNNNSSSTSSSSPPSPPPWSKIVSDNDDQPREQQVDPLFVDDEGSGEVQLDLELRLGPEPPQKVQPATTACETSRSSSPKGAITTRRFM